jgi:hypothetical protein
VMRTVALLRFLAAVQPDRVPHPIDMMEVIRQLFAEGGR